MATLPGSQHNKASIDMLVNNVHSDLITEQVPYQGGINRKLCHFLSSIIINIEMYIITSVSDWSQ